MMIVPENGCRGRTCTKVTFSSDQVTAGAANRMQNEFSELFIAMGGPKDAALFSVDDRDGTTHLYFSPEAARIYSARLSGSGAVECSAPARDGAALLAGHDGIDKVLLRSRSN